MGSKLAHSICLRTPKSPKVSLEKHIFHPFLTDFWSHAIPMVCAGDLRRFGNRGPVKPVYIANIGNIYVVHTLDYKSVGIIDLCQSSWRFMRLFRATSHNAFHYCEDCPFGKSICNFVSLKSYLCFDPSNLYR